MATDGAAGVPARSPGDWSAVAGHGGGPGDGCVPIPGHDLISGPEVGIGLQALGAGQPAKGVDAPAGIDRASASVGLAERCGMGVPGNARPHLTPHDRHSQLIADQGSHGTWGAGSGPGSGHGLGPGSRLSAGGGIGASGGLGPGSRPGAGGCRLSAGGRLSASGDRLSAGGSLSPGSLGLGSGLSPGSGLGTNFWPRIAARRRPGVAITGRVGTAILSECGKPAVRLKPVAVLGSTSVVWPDLDLHVGPSRCASGERRGAAGDVSCDRRMHGAKDRVAVARPVVPRSGAADAAYPVMPGCHRQAQWWPAVSERLVCPGPRVPPLRLALPLIKRPGLTVWGFMNRRSRPQITD